MLRFAYPNPVPATKEQQAVAAGMNIEIVNVPEIEPFAGSLPSPDEFAGIIVRKTALGLRAMQTRLMVGVFEFAPVPGVIDRCDVILHVFDPKPSPEQTHDPDS